MLRQRKLLTVIHDYSNRGNSAAKFILLYGLQPHSFGGDSGGKLDILQVGKPGPRKKRRVAVRKANKTMISAVKSQLQAERAKYVVENPTLAFVGVQLVCPDSVLDSICESVRFISVANDMDSFCLRQGLKQRFFEVIMAVVNS